MSDLTHLFFVGQVVNYRNDDFDALKHNTICVVKETYSDHIIITDTDTDTDLWIEPGFNLRNVQPLYEMVKERRSDNEPGGKENRKAI